MWRSARPLSEFLLAIGLWYGGENAASNAVSYAQHYSRSRDAVIRVYDLAGNVIETHELLFDRLMLLVLQIYHFWML